MDFRKTGAFIAAERKAKNLTQVKLAQALFVSEKTVSKWENGNGLPETAILLNLCGILDVTVNELLSGERLDSENYKEKAEDNIARLLLQRKSNRHKLLFSSISSLVAFSVLLVCVALASFLNIEVWLRISLIVYGFVIALYGLGVAVFYDIKVGSFVCKFCGKHFTPDAKSYISAYHTFTARRLQCPYCGKTALFKKSLKDKDKD